MFSKSAKLHSTSPNRGVWAQSRKHCFGAQPHGFPGITICAQKYAIFAKPASGRRHIIINKGRNAAKLSSVPLNLPPIPAVFDLCNAPRFGGEMPRLGDASPQGGFFLRCKALKNSGVEKNGSPLEARLDDASTARKGMR